MQQFQFLTRDEKIVVWKPYNPFAQGIVESINAHPIEEQRNILFEALAVSSVQGRLSVVEVNADYNIVLYLLELI